MRTRVIPRLRVLCDASFLLGYYDPTDQWHRAAANVCEEWDLGTATWVVPWPMTYEVFSTRMVNKRTLLDQVARHWAARIARHQLDQWDDAPYRMAALAELGEVRQWNRRLTSLADEVAGRIIADPAVHLDAVITMNARDFQDVCARAGVECLP